MQISNMDANAYRLQQADNNMQSNAARKEQPLARGEEINSNDFEKLLQGEGAKVPDKALKAKGRGDTELGATSGTMPEAQPSPFSLMDSLFGKGGNFGVSQSSTVQEVPPSRGVDDLVSSLVDRIAVNAPGKGDPTVSMHLNSGPLSGTELSISRAVDGQLVVKMDCVNDTSFQTAVSAQDNLRRALEKNENNVRIDINQNTGGEQDNRDRRSRGLDEYYF